MVTTQSVTSQPWSPWPRVSVTVSSTATKKAYGIDPSSTSSRNVTPAPAGAGSTRSPTVARNGLGSVAMRSTDAPVPTGRSMQMVVLSRKPTSRPKAPGRSAEHTSELQSHSELVCRLLLEKKKTFLGPCLADPLRLDRALLVAPRQGD